MSSKKTLNLKTEARYVKGVGPKMAKKLKRLEITTVKDLIHHYPFRHEDYSQISSAQTLQPGQKVTLVGQITKISSNYTRSSKQKTIQKAIFKDETGKINLIWFNQPYLKDNFKDKPLVSVSGKVTKRGNQLQIIFPDYEILKKGKQISRYKVGEKATKDTGRLVPIYQTTYGISNKYLRKIISRALPKVKNQIDDFIPVKIASKHRLIPRKEAVQKIHFPETEKALRKARKRLAFEELFLIHLAHLRRKKIWQEKQKAPKLEKKTKLIKQFINHLPFKLTSAQKKACQEILSDLNKSQPMNRLLQGDVGSGKTVVAAAAVLQAVKNGYQSVLMAPTEILAQQHYKTLNKLLKPFNVNCQLLTSSLIQNNETTKKSNNKLFIGTHALIHKHAKFNQVGLVIIDEQHRFGVAQRGKLIKKSQLADKDNLSPHILTMTATPIPRTITLTVYGDLDVSTINQLPPGRKPVKTSFIPNHKRQDCYQWIKKEVENGSQGFIICPLVEESEKLEAKAATEEYQRLKKKIFPDLKLGLLHGRIKSSEKEKILNQMHQGKIEILIATPVVEVGIDIPNAKFMIIEAANRFGLAQLHQLRGRVGRGNKQAYCFLFAEKISKKAKKRLRAMENINSGLQLAEIDLEIRGPGEIYGTKQHGYPELKVASYNNLSLIEKTRQAAQQIIAKNSSLSKYPQLAKEIKPSEEKPIAQN